MKPNPLTGLLVTVLALAVPHAAGQTLDYSTYFDGNQLTTHIAVDAVDDAVDDVYVTGFAGTLGGAFVAKLKPAGAGPDDLVWITFLQPVQAKVSFEPLALDGAGNVYVVTRDVGSNDTSVLRFDSAGKLEYSTVIGQGQPGAIAIHETGTERFVYVTGTTDDPLFPTNTGPAFGGANDAFVVKFEQIEAPPPA